MLERRASTSSSTRVRQRGAKRQPVGQVDQVRDVARDDRQLVLDRADDRDRPDQALGVGVERVAEQRRHVGLLDDLAGVHHRDPVAHLGDDAEVVGDQHDRRARSRRAGCASGRGSAPGSSRRARSSARRRSAARARRRGPSRSSPAGPCRPTSRAGYAFRRRSGSGMPTIRSSSSARAPRRPCPSCRGGCAGPPRSGRRRPRPG